MLTLLTGPLAWGLFAYHVYLIWAGMTTNESLKWADLRDDIADGFVFKRQKQPNIPDKIQRDESIEPGVIWPIWSTQELVIRLDGQLPKVTESNGDMGKRLAGKPWARVRTLGEIENLYDLGFQDNILDVLP